MPKKTLPQEHTPGPWQVVPEGHRLSVWAKDYGFVHTHEAPQVNSGATATANANARLIAAAPDLLKALKAMMPEGWGDDDTMDHMPGMKLARAAIAKAEGRDA